MGEAAIEVEQLSKTYVEGMLRRKKREALREVSFQVERGEIFGLLGGNGAGKTTFIKILLGIIRRSQGKATLLGYPAGDIRGRRRVGYLPENLRVPRHLTAITALEYYGHLSNVPSSVIRQRRGPLLERVGLGARANDPVRNYSKGMLQRLGLAQAMLHDPDIFILDEPTDGLDPLARSQVRGYLAELKQQGKTVFLNSHILQEVELICDRVAILDRGTLRRVANVKEITSGKIDGLAGANQLLEVQLDLVGDEARLREVLPADTIITWQKLTADSFRVVLRLPDQAAVDFFVDELRLRGASIIGLARRRISLEEAYLEIVAAESIDN
ncbi:putative ABC transporter ATP-binding protein YxlF [Anatilimnocola aggregata]|uniref:Putative ABC transporter ATP-binding protein YxlF n=2 Tax=Anatilimnocola aggregata TaxID=2528021 RepID=A0A517YN19_9BACT|nr:putative ABC transporter ATP-binding protein YxlF [Anatilimnocola aggregata]